MSEKILKFGNVIVNKKEFYASKKSIPLHLVDMEKIVIPETNLNIMTKVLNTLLVIISLELSIILCHMSGYIKYFDNGWKNMSFKIQDDNILVKYYDIGTKLKRH